MDERERERERENNEGEKGIQRKSQDIGRGFQVGRNMEGKNRQ